MNRLALIASSDDFLLEQAVERTISDWARERPDAQVEKLPDDISPSRVAVEISSPSLFAPWRILAVDDVRTWLKAAAPPDAPPAGSAVDPKALVTALEGGLPDGVSLVLGAWCAGKPKGPLVEAVSAHGKMRWIAPPPPPKPWEDADLSAEQTACLRDVVQSAAPELVLAPAAERLLFHRLGFAPRRLVQEAAKLAAATPRGSKVDEVTVERLILPRDGSIVQLQDALVGRDLAATSRLLAEVARGVPLRGWDGSRIPDAILPTRIFGIAFDLFARLLYTRCAVRRLIGPAELDPHRTAAGTWYPKTFKPRLEPVLAPAIAGDAGHPFGAKPPSAFVLGKMVRGASLYREAELTAALAGAALVERRLRRQRPFDALTPWLLGALDSPGRAA